MSELERVRLTRTRHIWQRKRGHRAGTDDILCAWAALRAAPTSATRALELGAGQGAVSMMLVDPLPALHITAVEAQVVSYELLERNVRENRVSERYELHCEDLRSFPCTSGGFDLVFGTPPFMPMGSGTLPRDAQRAAARFEMRGGIEAYCAAAANALRVDGKCAIVMDAARPERYEAAFLSSGLALERVIAVTPRSESPPTYLVYEARRSDPGGPAIERTELAIRGAGDAYTAAYEKIRTSLNQPSAREVWL